VLKSLSQNARVALLGTFGAAAAFFMFGGASDGGGSSSDPFDAVPRDSFLVATANLAELRRSPLYEVLLGKDPGSSTPALVGTPVLNARALGMGTLADACGFDPLSRVDTLAVAVPEEGDKGELGVAARVNVTGDELSRCTSALADKRGGKIETKQVGSFAVVEDPAEASADRARPRLAYGHGGLLVAGRGAWFDAMVAASDHKAPGAREAPAHVAMRTSLMNRDGWRSPTLVVSALLPRSLRDRIKNEMGAEVGAKDNSQNVMGGVLGVSMVGLALKAGTSGQNLDVAVELVCDKEAGGARMDDGAEACGLVEKLILKKRLEWSKELTLRMVGLGPLLDSIEVKRDGARLRVTAGAPASALANAIDRVLRFRARQREDERPPPGPPPNTGLAAPAPPPTLPHGSKDGRQADEIVTAPRPSASAATPR
jgi:hypothetical protein